MFETRKTIPPNRYQLQRIFLADKYNIRCNMKINPNGKRGGNDISFRKRILLTSRGYASQTTIHGIVYLFESRPAIERHLWFISVVAAMMFTIFQTSNLYTHWQNEPVITSILHKTPPWKRVTTKL